MPTTSALPRRPGVEKADRRRSGRLPSLSDLPIPRDVKVGKGWTGQMIELAECIGPYTTLRLVEHYGGEIVYVSHDATAAPFGEIVSHEKSAILSAIYGGCRVQVPVGRSALFHARRAPVIAAVRAGTLTGAEAQTILGTSRTYVSHLVNATDEGVGIAPLNLAARSETLLQQAITTVEMALESAFGTLVLAAEPAGE